MGSLSKRSKDLFPGARAPEPRPGAPLTAMIGRGDTLRRIAAEIAGGARIVTVTGPPGIGKTRVALACLDRLEDARVERAWFCDLSQAKTAADLGFAVLTLLRGRLDGEHVAEDDVEARVVDALAGSGRALLVLDNFEQLVVAAPQVAAWCRAAPEVAVLVTSRERLAVEGEIVIELAPLSCPAESDDAATVEASEAVRLFMKRARDAGGVIGGDARALGAITRRLEGIPLAIELAAARTRLMSLEVLAERLAAGEAVLAGATRRAADRHATLTAAIEWSWNLLSQAERVALARCSVFAGSFTLDAAERVVGEPGALEALGALRDKSLVFTTPEGRLALYVSVRAYAAERLVEIDGPAGGAQVRHARVFGEMARRFARSRCLQGSPERGLHAALRAEKENLAQALAFARERTGRGEDAVLLANLAAAAAPLNVFPGEACVAELTRALAALGGDYPTEAATVLAARQGVYGSLARYDECLADLQAIGAMPGVPPTLQLYALVWSGAQLRFKGSPREALLAHEKAAALLETTDFPRLRAMNDACLGRLKCDFGDAEASRFYNERAFALCETEGDTWTGGLALANLAQLEQQEQQFDRARVLISSALEMLRVAGEPHYEAVYASACGDLFFEWGEHDVARRWYDEGARFFRSFMTHRQAAVVHAAAAALEAHDGDLARAHVLLDVARRSALRAKNPVVDAVVELHGASVALEAPTSSEARNAARATTPARACVVEEWRAKIALCVDPESALGRVVSTSFDARFALRMARRALDAATRADAREQHAAPAGEDGRVTLRVASDGGWLELVGRPRVDLGRRGALRRILMALAEHHAAQPGRGLSQDDLFVAGWPGQRVLVHAAATRVRVAVATLRRLGLRDVLVTRDDGYALDPRARVERSQ